MVTSIRNHHCPVAWIEMTQIQSLLYSGFESNLGGYLSHVRGCSGIDHESHLDLLFKQ